MVQIGKIAAATALTLLAGCAQKVGLPEVSVQALSQDQRMPGNYAAFVQSGGWHLDAKPIGMRCTFVNFDTDINMPYETAMKDVIAQSVEKVTFVGRPLPPEELKAQNYDALLVVHQGNADASYLITKRLFFGVDTRGTVALNTIVAVIRPEGGSTFQQSVESKDSAMSDQVMCNMASDAIGKAASGAMSKIVTASGEKLREGLDRAKQQR